jgi:hypothetical protein
LADCGWAVSILGVAAPNKKITDAWMAIYLAIAKLTDSGLGVFVIIGAVIVGLALVLTHGLDSKDRLTFLQYLLDLRVFAWGGWVVTAVTIVVARWLLKKERVWYEREISRLDEVKEKAIQAKLDLPESKPKKQ